MKPTDSSQPLPTLHDLLPWVRPYISIKEYLTCKTLSCDFALSIIYCSSLSYTRPWQPHRHRKWGFGTVNTAQSSVSDFATGHLILHHTWHYLTPRCRARVIITSSTMLEYTKLRLTASTTSIAHLRHLRPAPTKLKLLDPLRARAYGGTLLRFDFLYGDFIRWFSGEYTNRHRDWQTIFRTMLN